MTKLGLASAGEALFCCFARTNVTTRKADLMFASLRCATGNLRCPVKTRSTTTRLWLNQVFALIRFDLRSSAQPEGVGGNSDSGSDWFRCDSLISCVITAKAGIAPPGITELLRHPLPLAGNGWGEVSAIPQTYLSQALYLSRKACVAPRKIPRSLPTATNVAPISM